MLGVTVQINSFELEPQPGWVECSLFDANGREWQFGMKTAYLYCADLEETNTFPQSGTVPCELLWQGVDPVGREIAKISTLEPWGVDSHEGETSFVVFAQQLTEVKNETETTMNAMIDELDVVRVATLLQSDRQFSGSEGVSRAPRVGDRATVVHVLQPGHAFIVEAVDSDGYTLWLADFLAEELQLEIKYRSRN